MAKNPISNKADNDRIQIRSFWISERKAPYVYSFLKKTELSHRGDQLDLIRSAIREGANKQVISSQADSLIKISRIWADFFPANTSNQPI
ncbi:hypothetical protein BM468_23735 [Salmonella enterica subsp. enterica serovar Kentucky]|nr:hypothetical protein [Salmonella enterica subsp. enterica serovar Kentucky]EEI7228339.1 hypothetical protein [Salmonella enterica subsp. enterica]